MTHQIDLDYERLREAFREMLLPIAAELEDDALSKASGELGRLGVDPEDQPAWVALERDEWAEAGEPSHDLAAVIGAYLAAGDPDIGDQLSSAYLDLYDTLRDRHVMSHEDSCAFLSHSRLIARLAREERMSAAQIERLLRARDSRVDFSWRAVQRILARLRLRPSLIGEDVEELFAVDQDLEHATFADAGLETSAEMIGDVADRLGFPDDLEALCLTLYTPDGETFGPYLQILHFLCVIAEFYDHALSVLYEFAPRGGVAEWIFDQYPEALAGAGNPVLNNAKGFNQLTRAWAASREDRLEQARSLVDLVTGLESMGFSARRELASWLRRWLVRLIRLTEPLGVALPDKFNAKQIERILSEVSSAETNTQGIIEQRLVDALTSQICPEPRWRARGLGDSVNASNVSRRKLGDCDFQDAASRKVIAWEAHAGRLTDVYVDGHRRTLRRALALRRSELEGIADPGDWKVEVVFIGHGLDAQLPTSYDEDGISVEVGYQDYRELVVGAPKPSALVAAFKAHVNSALNQRRTPQYVRKRLLEIAKARASPRSRVK